VEKKAKDVGKDFNEIAKRFKDLGAELSRSGPQPPAK
jgi:hypothetical protein